MDNFVLVEINQSLNDLLQVVSDFHFSQSLPTLYQLVESLVGTELQQDIDVLVVLKHMLEFNDVRVT